MCAAKKTEWQLFMDITQCLCDNHTKLTMKFQSICLGVLNQAEPEQFESSVGNLGIQKNLYGK
jgi:hypothetical protein